MIKAQNNIPVLSDVTACLCDAMDTMFNNNHNIIMPEYNNMSFDIPNNGGLLSVEALKSLINKRKLVSTAAIDEEQINQQNGNDSAKRLCTMNCHQHEQKA